MQGVLAMKFENLSRWASWKRAWLAGTLLLLVVAVAGCDSDKFVIPPVDDEVMTMAAMGLNCQEGTPSFQVDVEGARVRTGPSVDNPAYGMVHFGEIFEITDVSEDFSWVAYELEEDKTAWIYADLTLLFCQ